jgi:hypothetical protein
MSAATQVGPPTATPGVINTPPSPAPVNNLANIPLPFLCTLMVFILMAAYYGVTMPPFGMPSFLSSQMMANFLMSVIISVVYGIVCNFFSPDHFFNKFQNVAFPVVLIGFLWLKAYTTYAANLRAYCRAKATGMDEHDTRKPYRPNVLLWNTSKIAIASLLTYLFVSMCSWTLTPFFELFGSAHPLIFFFGVGFWVGCATWPAEASCFFAIQKDGCVPLEKVSFADLDAKLADMPDPVNGKT